MNTMQVGELKTQFSTVLENVKRGEDVVISYGKRKIKIAVIIPYKNYICKKRKIGMLKGIGFSIAKNFNISDEEFLNA